VRDQSRAAATHQLHVDVMELRVHVAAAVTVGIRRALPAGAMRRRAERRRRERSSQHRRNFVARQQHAGIPVGVVSCGGQAFLDAVLGGEIAEVGGGRGGRRWCRRRCGFRAGRDQYEASHENSGTDLAHDGSRSQGSATSRKNSTCTLWNL